MIKQVENQNKLHNFFFLVNLNYTMNYLLQQCFKTFRKIQLFIGDMKICFQEIMIPHFYPWHVATKAL